MGCLPTAKESDKLKRLLFYSFIFVLLVFLSVLTALPIAFPLRMTTFTVCTAVTSYLYFRTESVKLFFYAPIAFLISFLATKNIGVSFFSLISLSCALTLIICVKRRTPRTMTIGIMTATTAVYSACAMAADIIVRTGFSSFKQLFSLINDALSPFVKYSAEILSSSTFTSFSPRVYEVIMSLATMCIPAVFALGSMLCCTLCSVLFKFLMLFGKLYEKHLPHPWLIRTDVYSALLFTFAFFASVFSVSRYIIFSSPVSSSMSLCLNVVLIVAPLMAHVGIKRVILYILKRKSHFARIASSLFAVAACLAFPPAALLLLCILGVSVSLKGSLKLLILKTLLKSHGSGKNDG